MCVSRVCVVRVHEFFRSMSASLLQALAERALDATVGDYEAQLKLPFATPLPLSGAEEDLAQLVTDDDEDDDSSSEGGGRGSQASMSFTLNGETWTFENPVPLVLSAARQLGMAIGRDASLLWIADEALLDEFDDDESSSALKAPELRELPLSDEVATHYGAIFKERSRPLQLEVGDETTSAKLAAHKYLGASGSSARRSKGGGVKRGSKTERRKERQRRRLDLREARLSGITERFTEEMVSAIAEEPAGLLAPSSPPLSPAGQSPSSLSAPAVWPSALPDFPPTGVRMRGTLPRIDSSSMALDQLEQLHAESQTAAVAPSGLCARVEDGNQQLLGPNSTGRPHAIVEATVAGGSTDGIEGALRAGDAAFARGDVVEVDFDDEGWMRGVVEEVHTDLGVAIYAVRMADGEIAEDVEGSEIRAPCSDEKGDSSSEDGGYANTRSEGFSAFDQASVLGADTSPQADRRELNMPQMSCRPTESGVAWEFIACEDINWSPPTESMLQAHMEAQRQREEWSRSPV